MKCTFYCWIFSEFVFKKKDKSQNHIGNFEIWPDHQWLLLLTESYWILSSWRLLCFATEYWYCSIMALCQTLTASQEQCSKIHLSLHESGSRCACSMSSWPPLSSEGNMRQKTSSLCSRSISQFVLNSEFSYFLVSCSVSSSKDNIWQDKIEQDRSFVLLLNASPDLLSVGQWFSGVQLSSTETFIGTRSSWLPVQHVLWLESPAINHPLGVSGTMQKQWLLCKPIVCPEIKLKVARNFNIIY